MITQKGQKKIQLLSDAEFYPQAVEFMRGIAKPLPSSQINGLLNVSLASTYSRLTKFMAFQSKRTTWKASERHVPEFYKRLAQKLPEERQGLLIFSTWRKETEVTECISGRIFYEQGELRWERQQNHMQVVYIGKRECKPELNQGEEIALEDCERISRNYFLFGKRLSEEQRERISPTTQPGDFVEVRIPRLLRYPVLDAINHADRIQLAICEYVDRITGAIIAYRIEKLVPFQQSLREVQ
jgi:hypothetical protein